MSENHLEFYATRLYLVLLTMCILVLMTYSSLEIRTNTFTVQEPSLTTFERLNTYYATTLQCPCSEVSVPHKKFFTPLQPRLHQVSKRRSSRLRIYKCRLITFCVHDELMLSDKRLYRASYTHMKGDCLFFRSAKVNS